MVESVEWDGLFWSGFYYLVSLVVFVVFGYDLFGSQLCQQCFVDVVWFDQYYFVLIWIVDGCFYVFLDVYCWILWWLCLMIFEWGIG